MSEQFRPEIYSAEQAANLKALVIAGAENMPCEIRRSVTFRRGPLKMILDNVHMARIKSGKPYREDDIDSTDPYAPEGNYTDIKILDDRIPVRIAGSQIDMTVSESGTMSLYARTRDPIADIFGKMVETEAGISALDMNRPAPSVTESVFELAGDLIDSARKPESDGYQSMSVEAYRALGTVQLNAMAYLASEEADVETSLQAAIGLYNRLQTVASIHGSPNCVVEYTKLINDTSRLEISHDVFDSGQLGRNITDDVHCIGEPRDIRLLRYGDGRWTEVWYSEDDRQEQPASQSAMAHVITNLLQ